jgi:hypothetical protein
MSHEFRLVLACERTIGTLYRRVDDCRTDDNPWCEGVAVHFPLMSDQDLDSAVNLGAQLASITAGHFSINKQTNSLAFMKNERDIIFEQ